MSCLEAEWTVPGDLPALEGHFPGRPVVPGVVWLQQVVDLAATRPGLVPVPSRWPRVKFPGMARPGDRVRIRVTPAGSGFDFLVQGPAGPVARGQCRSAS